MNAPDTIYLPEEETDRSLRIFEYKPARERKTDIPYDRRKTCIWTWSDVDETGQEDGACVTTSCGHRVEPAPGLQIRCHICGGVIEITDCDAKGKA